MRLYVVGIESAKALLDALQRQDLSFQVISDAHQTAEIACGRARPGAVACYLPPSYANQTDCDCLLRVWNRDGRYSLIQIGGILNLGGAHALLAVPRTLRWRLSGLLFVWKNFRRGATS